MDERTDGWKNGTEKEREERKGEENGREKGGKNGWIGLQSSSLLFQPSYQHSILQRQHRCIFHKIVRLDLPLLQISSERLDAVSMFRQMCEVCRLPRILL